jgi:hypothetical protein
LTINFHRSPTERLKTQAHLLSPEIFKLKKKNHLSPNNYTLITTLIPKKEVMNQGPQLHSTGIIKKNKKTKTETLRVYVLKNERPRILIVETRKPKNL